MPFELHGECVHMCVCVWFATLGILRVGQDGILSQRRCAASRRENDRERVLAEERAFTNWVILDGLPLSLSLSLSSQPKNLVENYFFFLLRRAPVCS